MNTVIKQYVLRKVVTLGMCKSTDTCHMIYRAKNSEYIAL